MKLNYRALYFLCFVLGLVLVGGATLIENQLGIRPCLLCLLQRFMFYFLIIFFFIGFIFAWPRIIKIVLNCFVILFSIGGWVLAARQVWLQNVSSLRPHAALDCLPDATFLLSHFPFATIVKLAVMGTQECSQVDWLFLGFSLAKWSLLFFLLFFLVGIRQFFGRQ